VVLGVSVMMSWLSWALLGVGLVVLFVVWDLVFCGGGHCKRFIDDWL